MKPAGKKFTYRGRFAPSPTGPLHFGSIVAALGSYLQAKKHGGEWYVRIEDIDIPRTQKGAAANILHTLEAFGLHWDGAWFAQSARTDIYAGVLDELHGLGLLYPCACPRRQVKGLPYPGTCRGQRTGSMTGATALRITVDDSTTGFNDGIQGRFQQRLSTDVGDFVVRRSDGIHAYHLAVVIDDYLQGITEIVRGADLLDSTPRQIYLQRVLSYATPDYCHLPVAADRGGLKISKQNHAPRVTPDRAVPVLHQALQFLGHHPPPDLLAGSPADILHWGIAHWNIREVPSLAMIIIP